MQASNSNGFQVLFQEFYPDLVKIASFYVHDLPVAEDIVQEVFARLWEKGKQPEAIGNLKGYLSYAVKNRCLNYLDHLQVVDRYQQEYLRRLREEEESPEEQIRLVGRLLEKLPPKRRQILEMSVVEGKSYQEIAQELAISINTVKDHIKKAYAFLREAIQHTPSDYILYLAFTYQHKK